MRLRVALGGRSRARSGRATSLSLAVAAWGFLQLRPRLGCGCLPASWLAGWACVDRSPPSLTRPHTGFSPSLPPTFPSSPIPTDPGFLTWSRLGLQLPDVLPTPPPPSAPTGHGPRPASPAWSACAPPWRTWVSRARVPLCPALHQPLDALPHPGAPWPSPASPHPASCPLASALSPRLLSDSTSPFLPLPSCLSRASRSLPPFLSGPFAPSCGRAGRRVPARGRPPGLRGSGMGGSEGSWVRDWESRQEREALTSSSGKERGLPRGLGEERVKGPSVW